MAAEQVIREIRELRLEERREIWQKLSQLVVEPLSSTPSDAEFEAALDAVTGCTAQRNVTGRLLDERQREQAQVEARANSRLHG